MKEKIHNIRWRGLHEGRHIISTWRKAHHIKAKHLKVCFRHDSNVQLCLFTWRADSSCPRHSIRRAAAMSSAPLMSGTSRNLSSSLSHSRSEARSKSSTASTEVSERRTDAPLGQKVMHFKHNIDGVVLAYCAVVHHQNLTEERMIEYIKIKLIKECLSLFSALES